MHKELPPSDLGLTFAMSFSLPIGCFSTWRPRWGLLPNSRLQSALLSSEPRGSTQSVNIIKRGKRNVYTNLWFLIKAKIAGFVNENFWPHMWDLQLPLAPINYDLWGAEQCPGGLQSLLLWHRDPFILSPANVWTYGFESFGWLRFGLVNSAERFARETPHTFCPQAPCPSFIDPWENQAHLFLIHLHFTHQNVGFGWIPLFSFQETFKNVEWGKKMGN